MAITPQENPAARLKYTGHERDTLAAGNSLDYMHARYYSPTGGRFLSTDKGKAQAQRPQSWNRYSYCWGDPVQLTDPTGNIVELAGARGRRLEEFEAIADSLEDPTAAGQLVMVTFSNGRSIVSITGDVSSFAASSPTAGTIAAAVASPATITFFLGSNSFNSGDHYPAYTAPVDAHLNFSEGSRNSLISIDPSGLPYYTARGYYENLRSAIQHEFGHALGIAGETWRGRLLLGPDSGTNPDAVIAENKARDWYRWQTYKRFGVDSPGATAADTVWRDRPNHGH